MFPTWREIILFPALNRTNGNRPTLRNTVLGCQSPEDKDCIGKASKERNVTPVSRSRGSLRWVSDPDDVVQILMLTHAGVWSWHVFLGLSLLTCRMEIMVSLPHRVVVADKWVNVCNGFITVTKMSCISLLLFPYFCYFLKEKHPSHKEEKSVIIHHGHCGCLSSIPFALSVWLWGAMGVAPSFSLSQSSQSHQATS